jgi:hypothetical protein
MGRVWKWGISIYLESVKSLKNMEITFLRRVDLSPSAALRFCPSSTNIRLGKGPPTPAAKHLRVTGNAPVAVAVERVVKAERFGNSVTGPIILTIAVIAAETTGTARSRLGPIFRTETGKTSIRKRRKCGSMSANNEIVTRPDDQAFPPSIGIDAATCLARSAPAPDLI